MKNVKIVIGANFGDEGKGLMTDYFCSEFPITERVLNVRFNGGAQAGHTVVAPDGCRHIFSHFGSGSFLSNVATYLGPEFIVNPILFRREYEKLTKLGVYPMVYCHPNCIFTMPQDMMVNQFIEKRRQGAGNPHGSCGIGIFETKLRNEKEKRKTVSYFDGYAMNGWQMDLSYYDSERIEKVLGCNLTDKEKALMINQNVKAHYNQDVRFFMDHVTLMDQNIFHSFNNVVFEGAQGLLLDQNNTAYFPYLTPSHTGVHNTLQYLNDDMDVEVCYVSRPYMTRHGAGPLPGECTRQELGAGVDLTNHLNEWQGEFRYAKLNLGALVSRCSYDAHCLGEVCKAKMSIAITHMDELIRDTNLIIDIKNGLKEDSYPIRYLSDGPCRTNVSTDVSERWVVEYKNN